MNCAPFHRLVALDAAKGVAMLLVCTAHFFDVYGGTLEQGGFIVDSLVAFTKVATPSFVLASGFLLGYFYANGPTHTTLRIHLLDRAIFLVTLGHLLMASTFALRLGWVSAVSHWYITDTLGLCLLGGMAILHFSHTSLTKRLAIGTALYMAGWASWNSWHPDNSFLVLAKTIFLGPDESGPVVFWFPLIPWFGVYLVGTCIGSWLATLDKDCLAAAGQLLVKYSFAVFATASCAKAFMIWLQIPRSIYLPLLSMSKNPPGPLYLLTFGSAALMFLGSALTIFMSSIRDNPFLAIAQRLGRNSFSVFLAQSLLYYTMVYILTVSFPKSSLLMGLTVLSCSLFCIIWLSGLFEQTRLSRAWTVGLTILMKTSAPSSATSPMAKKAA